MEKEYKKAFSDVLYLINELDPDLRNKISKNFIRFMEENCDKNYTPTNIYIEKADTLSMETKTVLSVIYKTYLCKDGEKNSTSINRQQPELESFFKSEVTGYEKIDRKINYTITDTSEPEEVSLIKINKVQKIIYKIKNFFKKLTKRKERNSMSNEFDKLAEYRERMEWAKEHNDKENFMKYYDLYKQEYEKLSNKKFEDQFNR